MENEQPIIVSGRVGTASGVVPGSDIVECSECHAPVWRSPSSKQIEKEMGTLRFLCTQCAEPHLKAAGPDDLCPVNNGQLKEIADYFGISVAKAATRLKELMESFK